MPFVIVIPQKVDEEHWVPITRWLEAIVGDLYQDWDNETHGDQVLYSFKHERFARMFDGLWNRSRLVFPYPVWEEFCQNDLSRARFDSHWDQQGWRPEIVVFDTRRVVSETHGGRYEFRKNIGVVFFEKVADALVYLMETGNE